MLHMKAFYIHFELGGVEHCVENVASARPDAGSGNQVREKQKKEKIGVYGVGSANDGMTAEHDVSMYNFI